MLTRAVLIIESGRNTPQKWDRLRLLPRHIRTALPLLPSGPGGVHAFVIARSPEPDIQISNFTFETRDRIAERAGLEPEQAFRPAALPTRCHTNQAISPKHRRGARRQGAKNDF